MGTPSQNGLRFDGKLVAVTQALRQRRRLVSNSRESPFLVLGSVWDSSLDDFPLMVLYACAGESSVLNLLTMTQL
jgi:hypothetical protein